MNIDLIYLDLNPIRCLSKSYDITINGVEVGGGTSRNEKKFLQKKIFLVSLNLFELSYNFSFFINFYKGAPPQHAGVGIGIDRIIMVVLGINSLSSIDFIPILNHNFNFIMKSPNFIF